MKSSSYTAKYAMIMLAVGLSGALSPLLGLQKDYLDLFPMGSKGNFPVGSKPSVCVCDNMTRFGLDPKDYAGCKVWVIETATIVTLDQNAFQS